MDSLPALTPTFELDTEGKGETDGAVDEDGDEDEDLPWPGADESAGLDDREDPDDSWSTRANNKDDRMENFGCSSLETFTSRCSLVAS